VITYNILIQTIDIGTYFKTLVSVANLWLVYMYSISNRRSFHIKFIAFRILKANNARFAPSFEK